MTRSNRIRLQTYGRSLKRLLHTYLMRWQSPAPQQHKTMSWCKLMRLSTRLSMRQRNTLCEKQPTWWSSAGFVWCTISTLQIPFPPFVDWEQWFRPLIHAVCTGFSWFVQCRFVRTPPTRSLDFSQIKSLVPAKTKAWKLVDVWCTSKPTILSQNEETPGTRAQSVKGTLQCQSWNGSGGTWLN